MLTPLELTMPGENHRTPYWLRWRNRDGRRARVGRFASRETKSADFAQRQRQILQQ